MAVLRGVVHLVINVIRGKIIRVNIISGKDLDPTPRPEDIAELQLEGVGTDPNPTDVVVDAHLPDGENRGERTFRAVVRQCLLKESCSE